jgi:hypothetical protein
MRDTLKSRIALLERKLTPERLDIKIMGIGADAEVSAAAFLTVDGWRDATPDELEEIRAARRRFEEEY